MKKMRRIFSFFLLLSFINFACANAGFAYIETEHKGNVKMSLFVGNLFPQSIPFFWACLTKKEVFHVRFHGEPLLIRIHREQKKVLSSMHHIFKGQNRLLCEVGKLLAWSPHQKELRGEQAPGLYLSSSRSDNGFFSTLPLTYITVKVKHYSYFFLKYLKDFNYHFHNNLLLRHAGFSSLNLPGFRADIASHRPRAPTVSRRPRSSRSRGASSAGRAAREAKEAEGSQDDEEDHINYKYNTKNETQDNKILGFLFFKRGTL